MKSLFRSALLGGSGVTFCVVLFLGLQGLSQGPLLPGEPRVSIPTISLKFTASDPIPGMPGSLMLLMPVHCNSDTLFLDSVSAPDLAMHTIYSVRGSEVRKFTQDGITDLAHPAIQGIFPSNRKLAMLVEADVNAEGLPASKRPRRTFYISEFSFDGQYLKSIPLAIGFEPSHLAILSSGEYLVTGVDRQNGRAELVILDETGALVRPVDFPGSRQRNDGAGALASVRASDALMGSIMLTSFGDSVLVWHSGSRDPIVQVFPGRAVKEVPLQIPKGLTLKSMVSAEDRWVAQFAAQGSNGEGKSSSESETTYIYYDINPLDGTLLRQIKFPPNEGREVACEKDGVYTSFETTADYKFVVLTAR